MTASAPQRCHETLLALLAQAEEDPRLVAEMQRARREFFGFDDDHADLGPAGRAAAATRFCEWYLLERDSDVLGGAPLHTLARRAGAGDRDALVDSRAGVFRIEASAPDETRAIDLQDQSPIDVLGLEGAGARGDLLIGRLYAAAGDAFVPSVALVLQRDAEQLARAFLRDLERLDLGRRLTQAELERLMFREVDGATQRRTVVPIERHEAELDAFLQRAGKRELSATEISAALRAAESPGEVAGPLLEEIAFDTQADIDELRRILLALWSGHREVGAKASARAAPKPGRSAPRVEGALGASLARRIEEGLAKHEDLDRVFADVDRMMGEEHASESEDAQQEPSFDTGDLAALVAEFLWETQTEGSAERAVLDALVRQQHDAPVRNLNIEYLEANDLLRLLVRIFLETPGAERARAVQHAFATLQRFWKWVETTQEYELGSTLAICDATFVVHVERVARASAALSTASPARGRPALWQVTGVSPARIEVTPTDGDERIAVTVAAAAARELQIGDLLLAGIERRREGEGSVAGIVLALPPGVEPLLG